MKKVFQRYYENRVLCIVKAPLFFLMVIIFSFNISANEVDNVEPNGKQSKKVFSKEDFVAAFIEKADIIDSLRYKIDSAQADYDKVLAQYFPKIRFVFGLGPHPKYEYQSMKLEKDGSGEYSIINDDWHKYPFDFSKYGVAIRFRSEFMMPVFTFGKILRGSKAAKANIGVKQAESEIGELKIKKEAGLIYWSWVMAKEMLSIMEPALKMIDEAEEKIEDMLYNEKEGVSQKDLIKLRIEKEKLAYQHKKLLLQIDTLDAVITEVVGQSWDFKDTYLKKIEYKNNFEDIVDHMFASSPHAKYLSNGLDAYENLYRLEVAKLFPDFGLAGQFSVRYTSSVYENDYPYANSPYNGTDGEVGIGLTLNLNFLEQARKIQKSKAEWNSMKAKAKFLQKSVPLEIKKMCNDLKSLEAQIKHVGNARRITKGWMTTEMANYGGGFSNTDDLVASLKAFFENEYLYIQSVFDYNSKVEQIIEFTGAE
jgi:outer membrane protein TolC